MSLLNLKSLLSASLNSVCQFATLFENLLCTTRALYSSRILCFPGAHIGRLIGTVFFVSGLITLAFGFLLQWLFVWTNTESWSGFTTYALIFLCLTLLAFVHPARLLLRRFTYARKFTREQHSTTI